MLVCKVILELFFQINVIYSLVKHQMCSLSCLFRGDTKWWFRVMSLTFNKEILVVSKLKIEDLRICSDFYYNS